MKLIRSTRPLIFGDLKKQEGIIATLIGSWAWNEELQRYEAQVKDYHVTDVVNPEPGAPLKSYVKINQRTRYRTPAEVNSLFKLFGISIIAGDAETDGDDYTKKQRDLYVKGLLLDTQLNPTYGSNPQDWEIVDTALEIAPLPEE